MLVYTHQNHLLVEIAKNTLEQAGIACETKNTTLQSGFGELSGIDTWPELWILNERDKRQAQAIVATLNNTQNVGKSWVCQTCGEKNEPNFDLCWQCQTARVLDEKKY